MRFSLFLLLFLVSYVICKNQVKSLTESMGQEIIEIGAPVKDFPPGIEEEPAAESEEDEKTTVPPKQLKKSTTSPLITTTKKKTADKEGPLTADEEEVRVEKELAQMYKDTDYKESETTTKAVPSRKHITPAEAEEAKPVARTNNNDFKFQPDINDRADVERFRTSIDEINCEKRVTQRLSESEEETQKSDVSNLLPMNSIATGLAILSFLISQ